MKQRAIAGTLAAVICAGALSISVAKPAEARSEDMWRVGTYLGLGGLGYGLAKHNSSVALIGAGVGLLSYTQWQQEMRHRHRRWRYADYCGYRDNWYRHRRARYYPARYERYDGYRSYGPRYVAYRDYGYRRHRDYEYRRHCRW